MKTRHPKNPDPGVTASLLDNVIDSAWPYRS
jgi:hypothetical protein